MKAEEFIISTGQGKLYSNELEIETGQGVKTYSEIIITDTVVMEGTLNTTSSLSKTVNKLLAGVLAFIGLGSKKVFATLASELGIIGNLTRKTSKNIAGILSISGTISKLIKKAIAGVLSSISNTLNLNYATIDKYNTAIDAYSRKWKIVVEIYFDGDDAAPTTFTETDVIRWQLLEEAQAEGSTPLGAVSSNEFILVLNNVDGDFTPSNTSSPYYGKLLPNVLVKAYCKLEVPLKTTVSYYKVHLGNYRTKDWTSPTNSIEATVVCYDDIYTLGQKTTPQLPAVQNVNLQQLTRNLLRGLDLDLSEFEIDEFLQEISIGWFLSGLVLNNLQLLATRGYGAIYGTRDELIKFRAYKNLEEATYYLDDTNQIVNADLPQVYYNTYSRVSVKYYIPYVGETSTLLNTEVTVPPGGLTLDRLEVSGPVGIYEGISVIYASDVTVGSMSAGANDISIEFLNTSDNEETVTLIVKGKKIEYNEAYVEVEDTDMISKIGNVTLEITANHLIQNRTSATTLANYILQIVKEPSAYVNVEIMGNPAILLTHTINIDYPNASIEDIDIVPLRIEHNFDGGMSGRIYGIKKSIKEVS